MNISQKMLWENRSGRGTSWFHPRACCCGHGFWVMTVQSIGGADYYGPVCESLSTDNGETWSNPKQIPGFEWKDIGRGIWVGICDVVTAYHAPSDTVLAMGHNVYYRDGYLFDSLGDWGEERGDIRLRRFPVWSLRNKDGQWRLPQKLEIPGFERTALYSCGSSQRLFLGDDGLLIPLTYGGFEEPHRHVTSVFCRYNGKEILFEKQGNVLSLPVGRGLLEPSIAMWQGRYLMTIRAEDGHGYIAESPDGLQWNEMKPWVFDNGEVLEMSTTQQHFLQLKDRLFLVYNRNLGINQTVMRFRAPLLIAEITPDLQLNRTSEQVIFPMLAEGTEAAGMGNFQPAESDNGSFAIVTVGEERGFCNHLGNTLAAKISIE